ncbi:MAG: hypothetical protein AAF711_01905 [Planctomycetota bacterium]
MPRLIYAPAVMFAASPTVTVPAVTNEKAIPATEPISPGKPVHLFNGKDLSSWAFDGGGKHKKPEEVYRITDGKARVDTAKLFINDELVHEAWDCSASSGAICL